MMTCTIWSYKKWLTVIGCLLMMFPVSVPTSWGNIGMYALSYLAERGRIKTGIDTPWIISTHYAGNLIGLYIAGLTKKQKTKRFVSFFAAILTSGGIFCTCWTVQESIILLTLSVGVLSGTGGGMTYGMAFQYAGQWADRDAGLVISLVMSGGRIGVLVINPLFTIFVNPDNLSPSTEVNSIKLFSQPEVLDRVPLAFIAFGTGLFILQIIGVACVKDRSCKEPEENHLVEGGPGNVKTVREDEVDTAIIEQDTEKDKTVKELMRSPIFYCISFTFFVFDTAAATVLNYYKEYGAVWIKSDYFLAIMVMPYVTCSALGTTLSGYVSDRIGVKKTLICLLSSSSLLFPLVYFTPMVNRWLYMFNILLIGFCFTPLFSIIAVAARHYFGQTHQVRNFFLAGCFGLLSNFVNPIVLHGLLRVGWLYVFVFGGVICTAGLVVIIVVLPSI